MYVKFIEIFLELVILVVVYEKNLWVFKDFMFFFIKDV